MQTNLNHKTIPKLINRELRESSRIKKTTLLSGGFFILLLTKYYSVGVDSTDADELGSDG